jgi:hypothetical protein
MMGMLSAECNHRDGARLLEGIKKKAMAIGAHGIIIQDKTSDAAGAGGAPEADEFNVPPPQELRRLEVHAIRFKRAWP